ncbi:MAG: hypothetical protein KDI31_19455, partial [Pseudomonadales bacterium]|nr:hypothetical protein [Pseudomonadales bacterium]
ALASASATRVLAVVAELADRAADFDTLLEELLAALHQMAVAHALGGRDSAGTRPPFSAEVVQLLYQIALMGYRDLQIAPDPRAGVEMTLLRMLAFAPDDAGLSVPALQAAQPSVSSGPGAEAAIRKSPAVAPRAAARTPDSDSWFTLVSELELGGVARMLAEHSVLAAQTEDSISLLLDRAHDMLLSDTQVSAVQRALSLRLGREMRLAIEPAELSEETPSQRRQREAELRQKDAQRLLEQDSTVQSLLHEFGGRLEDVRPLEAGRSSSGKGNPA